MEVLRHICIINYELFGAAPLTSITKEYVDIVCVLQEMCKCNEKLGRIWFIR